MSRHAEATELDEIDRYVRVFEREKEKLSFVPIRSHLPPPSDPRFLEVLKELILVEIELDGATADSGALEKYIGEYPELLRDPAALAEVGAALRAGPSAGGDLAGAARSYLDASRDSERSGRPLDIDRWLAGNPVRPEHAGLIRDLHTRAPGRALALSEGLASLPEAGQTFLGFRLVQEIGRGAFGRVFLATQGELADRPVALKVAVDDTDEARTLARLQHTNIVPIYSVHRAPPLIAVCMPFFGSLTFKDVGERRALCPTLPATGRSLFELPSPSASSVPAEAPPASVESAAPLNPLPHAAIEARAQLEARPFHEAILWLFARLAEGLDHAHRRGILHRDLKPANILLTDDGQPMLLDFNLAEDRILAPESAYRMGGTLPYMSPEQLEALLGSGRPIDARSDLFSLGVILFELLTGRPPYPRRRGQDTGAIAAMLSDRKSAPPDPRRLDRSIRPATAAILMHCLEPDPARRYRDASELLDDLERQLAHRPLRHARDRDLSERVGKWVRRHPGIRSLGVLAAGSAAIVVALGAAVWVRAERLADIEAAEAGEAFVRDADRSTLMLTAADPARRAEAIRETRLALGRFRVLDGPGWLADPRIARLPHDARSRLQERAGEAIESLVHATMLDLPGRDAAPADIRSALGWNRLAGECYGPGRLPRSLLLQRSELHSKLGEEAEARRAGALAESTAVASARDRLLLARRAIVRGEHKEAAASLASATQEDPRDFWAWHLLAVARERLQDAAGAEAAYTACLSLGPDYEEPWYGRGVSRARRGDLAGAWDDLTRAIALRPSWHLPYLNRGLVERGRGEFSAAIADVDRAIELGSPKAYAYFIRAIIRSESGDPSGARRDREEGMRHPPEGDDAWLARGLARMADDPLGSLADFDVVLTRNPRSLPALQNRAAALSALPGRDEDALAALELAAGAYPERAELHSGRGRMLAVLGRRGPATEAAERALALSHDPRILYQVGCLFAITSRSHPPDRDRAFDLIARALRNGFGHRDLPDDEDLDAIRSDPRFAPLLGAARERAGASGGRGDDRR